MKDSSSFMSGAPLEYQPLTQADNGEKGKIINKTSSVGFGLERSLI